MSDTAPESPVSKVNEEIAVDSAAINEQQTQQTNEQDVTEVADIEVGDGDITTADVDIDVDADVEALKKEEETSIPSDDSKPLTKLEESLQLRDKMEALIRRTVQTKKRCDKLDHDNRYLQEYVGNLMNSGDFLSKRV